MKKYLQDPDLSQVVQNSKLCRGHEPGLELFSTLELGIGWVHTAYQKNFPASIMKYMQK